MSEYKRQHFVPVFYLKSFSPDGRRIAILQVDKNKVVDMASLRKQCQGNFFYGEDLVLEHQFQTAEKRWSEAIQKIIDDEEINEEDKAIIKEFALFQRSRTKTTTEYRNEIGRQMTIEFCNSIALSRGIDPCKHQDIIADIATEKANRLFNPLEIMRTAQELKPYLEDLEVGIIEYDTKAKLISSDTPVIMKNPLFGLTGDGLGIMGIVLFFPVSPNKLVYITDNLLYSQHALRDSKKISNDENEVKILNTYQYVSADNIIYSHSSEHLTDLMQECIEARKRTQQQPKVSTLGTKEKKLIAVTERSILYDGELSFCKVPRVYKRIPKECKEPIPRYCNNDTKRMLVSKRQALINMNDLLKQKGFYGSLSKREFSKGSRDFFRQVDIYWTNHRLYYSREELLLEKMEKERQGKEEENVREK